MRYSLWIRALIGLWAVWFIAALIEAPAGHTGAVRCGMAGMHGHSAVAMPMGHGAHEAPSPSSLTTLCHPDGNPSARRAVTGDLARLTAADGSHSQDAPKPPRGCCGSPALGCGAVAILASASRAHALADSLRTVLLVPDEASFSLGRLPVTLPFATAPPLA